MRQPFIIVGAGTEVVSRVVLPACLRIRDAAQRWPEHVYALVTDGDEATRSQYNAARLPSDRAAFTYPYGETRSHSSAMTVRLYGKAARDHTAQKRKR